MSAEQVRSFLEATADDRFAALWVVAFTTGMRRGEMAGLNWEDIDLDDGLLSACRSRVVVHGQAHETSPKGRKGRRVALADAAVDALRRWRTLQARVRLQWGSAWAGDGHVFTSKNGTPLHPDTLTTAFNRAVKASHLPRIRLHDARHTAASLALQAGVNPKVVSEMLGHS